MRKTELYRGYDSFDFEMPSDDRGDSWARSVVQIAEMRESIKIVEQVLDRLEPGPTVVQDLKIGWLADSASGPTVWARPSSTYPLDVLGARPRA